MPSKTHYQKRKEAGLCTRCGKEKDLPDRVCCLSCREKTAVADKEKHDFYKSRNICMRCGHESAEPNRTLCFECAEKNNEYMKQRLSDPIKRENKKAKEIERKRLYKEQGRCIRCGKKSFKEKSLCLECWLKNKRLSKKYMEEKRGDCLPRYLRPDYGMCYICAKPVKEGKRVCEECYKNKMIIIAQMTEKATATNDKHRWRYDWRCK